MNQTSFFPQWRHRLAPLRSRLQHLRKLSPCHLEHLLNKLVPAGVLSASDEGQNSRTRIFCLRVTFWGFLYQALTPGCACRQVVHQVRALFQLQDGRSADEGSSAYCQARRRLPIDTLQRVRRGVADYTEKLLCRDKERWFGWLPKLVDGTSLTMPDTPKNQRDYPQSGAQKPGCGFPLMKLVGIFSLNTGVLLDYAKGNKHQHELRLLHSILDHFKPGDLVIADRGFCNFVLMALLHLRGVASVFRLHQARRIDHKKAKRLGKNDYLVKWTRPMKPRYLPDCLWQLIPAELTVRVLSHKIYSRGYRPTTVMIATTLSDPVAYPAEEIAHLYARRWKIELWLRDIKTTMGMERLRCLSPEMVHKELEMFLIAYNMLRALMTEASVLSAVPLDRISFKGTIDALSQFSIAIVQARTKKKRRQLEAGLLATLARDRVPERPGRREPRAIKRRPKPFPLLNTHRRHFKEIPHRSRYRKNNP